MLAPDGLGKLFILLGVVFLALGALFLVGGKMGWLGRLPGDIRIERESFTLYFPLATCILLSIVLTLLVNFLFRK